MINGSTNTPAQPPTYDGAMPVPITLTLNSWQQALNLLTEGPWKLANPLITDIQRQLQIFLETAPTVDQPRPQA
jgi:hypothetical protein